MVTDPTPAGRCELLVSGMHRPAGVGSVTKKAVALTAKSRYNETVMIKIRAKQTSIDGTVKHLFQLADGVQIEAVRMMHPYGSSICVSSQAGCSMGCAFCASGLLKKVRDLTAEEMLLQVILSSDAEKPADHVVVMGTGEPFDNFDEVLRFCNLISDAKLLSRTMPLLQAENGPLPEAIAPRHITVSTCGIVPGIEAFSQTEKRFNLAISLHTADNTLRNRLMPVNRKYPLEKLIPAASEYCRRTGRRTAFEYLLLDGVNDRPEDAEKLCALLSSADQHESFYVNLIPYNGVSEFSFQGTKKEKALEFYDILMKSGLKATLRKERGTDIDAACGQLRLSSEKQMDE